MASLAQAILLAKSQNGAALTALLLRVLRSRDAYEFGELLDLENVRALANDAVHKSTYDVLTLFAQGTYSDWKAARASYPELDGALLEKLRVLSILTLAMDRRNVRLSQQRHDW